MNNKIYRAAADIINLILGFLSLYAIMFTILLLTNSIASAIPFFLLSLLGALLSYFLRGYARHIWSFLLLHFFVTAILFFLIPSIPGKVLYICYMAGITIYSLRKKLRAQDMQRKNSPPSLLLIFGLLYLVNLQLHLPELNPVLFELTVISILLYLINSYLINFELYFSLHQESSNVPFKQIKAANHTIIVFFLGLSVTSMLAFTVLPLKEVFLVIEKGLLTLIRGLFSLLPGTSNKLSDVQESIQKKPPAKPFKLPEATAPSPFWQFIQNLIMTLITAALAIAAIALISYAIYKLYQAFYNEKRSLLRDNTEFISPFDKKDNTAKEKPYGTRNSIMRFWNQTNSDKIRKAFYKAVLSKKGKLPDPSATPVELSLYILSNSSYADKEISERSYALAFYYEKARYDKEECTKDDVENFKKLLH